MAFFHLEPFGGVADDDRFRTLCQSMVLPHLARGAEIPKYFDRDPAPEPETSAEDDIMAFFAARACVSGNTDLV